MEKISQTPKRTSSESPCAHHILRQTTHGIHLPPLYFSSPPNTSTLSALETTENDLGGAKATTLFHARDVLALRGELEGGMTMERRHLIQTYVMEIADPREKAVTELYLARYPGFVLSGKGKLSYCVEDMEKDVEGKMEKSAVDPWRWPSWKGCSIM